METQPHSYAYCYAVEIPRYVYVPEHDDFIDLLPAKIEPSPEVSDEA
jgi:hypothetical protein